MHLKYDKKQKHKQKSEIVFKIKCLFMYYSVKNLNYW